MFANFRLYGTVVLVILSLCLNSKSFAQDQFLNKENLKFQPPTNFALPYSNPSVCGIDFLIFDNSCTSSHRYDILVSGISPNQLGVNIVLEEVRIIIEHTWDSDLDITLESPNNKVVELSTDNGGGADNYGDPTDITCSNYTAFSMNGCQLITEGNAPFVGTYIPEGNFNNFHDGSDPNGTWTLQMCDDASSDVGTLQFVELVFSIAVCDAPSNLMIENFDSTSAGIAWDTDNCANTIIEYGPPGFSPGTDTSAGEGTVVSVSCPASQPYTIGNLLPETEYEIYVRTECTTGGFTNNSCLVSFKTDCTTPSMTLSENFDAQIVCGTNCGTVCEINGLWSNSLNDDFDWLVDANGTTSSNTGPTDDITGGGNYIYIETSGSACQDGKRADLISNCLLIGASSESCHFSFYYHMFGASVNTLSLDISVDEGLNWVNLWSLSGEQGNSWEKVFIDLGAYNNEIAKMRFSGFSGDSFNGDIAIDHIQFYGTAAIGDPANTYYYDNDGDGYGDLNDSLLSCSTVPPENYVTNATDCDDDDNLIHPDATEIPCNSIDENCNGMTDDGILPDPVISNTDVCFGSSTTLTGTGNLYWYDAAIGGNLLDSGNSFNTGILTSDAVFYVIDSLDVDCKSERISINVSVHLNPDINTSDAPEFCAGQSFDLNSVNVVDYNNTGGVLTFHSASPANTSNELGSPIITPLTTKTYYILSTTSFGCTDETELVVFVKSRPEVAINPPDTSKICKNGSKVLNSFYLGGGLPPFSYEWNNGSTNTIAAFPAGLAGSTQTVWLSITDDNGCSFVDTVFIETVESITSASTSSFEVTTCGGSDGMITVTPIDGIPPYQITWSGPVSGTASGINGSYNIQNLEQGAYNIHISDSDPYDLDCQMTIPIVIVNGPSATVDTNIIITDVSCIGQLDGSIDISVSGNAPTFLWSDNSTSEDITNVSAGIYSVTITDGICTNVISDIEIEEPDTFSFIPSISDASCFGFNDGSIEIDVFGGTPPYTITWNNSGTGEQINDLVAGDYSFSLTDINGCVFNSSSITVDEPQALQLEIIELLTPACYEGINGGIDILITGGTEPYEFLWNNNAVSEDIYQLSLGEYEVSVTDANGCVFESSPISITEPDILSYNISMLQAPSCNNLSDGSIDIEIFGGTFPYQYEWSNGADTEDIDNLEEGMYSLTVTDTNNCETYINNIELVAPSIMTVNLDAIQNSFCDGVANGVIDVSINGGTGPYSYYWNNAEIVEDLNNLEAGNYQLTVTDMNGCTIESDTFLIVENTSFQAISDQINNVSCNSYSNGSIYLSTTGGLFPYDFNWNNGDETEDIENLNPGDYYATITDANGCLSYTDTFTIIEPEPLNIEVNSVEMPNCNGFENGSIDVQIDGGTGSYIFSWNNGATTEDLANVPSGLFQLTVQDENNCVASTEIITIDEPANIEINVESIINVGCSGIDEGSIEIEVSGGIYPFEYQWNTGDSTQNLIEIPSGYYAITVTDFNGCQAILSSINVEQLNDGLLVEPNIIDSVSCHEASDGSLSISMSGGTAPFQYNWSNGVITSVNPNLSGGFYNVTVTDANGCVGISSFIEVYEPDELQFYLTDFGHNDCFDSNNGFLTLEINGGTSPYHFLWSNGDTTQNISNLPSGSYSVTITDSNGCSKENSNPFQIFGPSSNISVSVLSKIDVPCFGFQNGSISLDVNGGVAPYSFDWNTGATMAMITQLSGGIYTCQVTDANNCITEEISVEIMEPEFPLTIDSTLIIDNFYCNDSTGSISLYLSGGTPLYSYNWNNGDSTSIIENLGEGSFDCTITDVNGCFLNSAEFFVESPLDDLDLNTNSTPETLGFSDGTATVIPIGGTPPYSYLWDDNAASQTDSTAVDLMTGTYEVTVTDFRGCTSVTTVEVGFLTEINQINLIETFKLFPNPTNSYSQLEMEFSKQVALKVEVYSILGKRIFYFESDGISFYQKINFSNYVAGVYFLKLTIDDKQSFTQKIIFID